MKTSGPKRILMTADTIGGVWGYATELIRALQPHGFEVLLATMGQPVSRSQQKELSDLSNVELAESTYKLEWMDDPWSDIEAAGEWLLGLENYFQPDLIHINGYAQGALAWRAPKIVVGHSCVLSWWEGVKGEHPPAEWARYREAARKGLKAADAVIAPTAAMLASLQKIYGPLSFTQFIPNGRRIEQFTPGKKENIVLSAGRLWDEAKNVRAVCASSSGLPWPVFLAGETRHPDGLAAAAEFSNVRCLGQLDSREMADWFSRASIYALPAKYEPFGLSVLEAALSGCVLLLGDIPSLRENWEGAAVFVDPRDCAQVHSVLHELIQDERGRNTLALRARERAQKFKIENTAARYLDIYQQLAARCPILDRGASGKIRTPEEECLAV
ncbi:MAG TPA: glycosyltransferase family 4 protein [Verrucomicrobiae bacterium]|nr:glycosyltransferase family 4 protein [Verrucomicrobiae bacterium]